MKEKIIISKRDEFKISGVSYDYYSATEIKRYKKVKIYVLEQDIFTSYILENKYKNVKKAVQERVMTLFNEDEDCLVHYELVNRDKYVIYTLRGGRRVEALCEAVNDIKIIPIQFKLFNNIKEQIKEKEYSFLYYLDEGIYYTKIKEDKINKSYFANSIHKLLNFMEVGEKIYFYEDKKFDENILKEYTICRLKKRRSDSKFEKIFYE